jgi:hypothetical protein
MTKNDIIDLGALIIALLALLQPWIIYLWKKYIRPGSVFFFETGTIEVGFSNYASTIGISGTLRAIDKDFYISGIKLELTKTKDSSKHYFDWAVFRDTKISLEGNGPTNVELPYGMLLSTSSPQRLNIQFHDRKQQEHIKTIYDNLAQHWQNYLDVNLPYEKRRNLSNNSDEIYNIFEKFITTKDASNAYKNFNREFYWESGNYQLIIKVHTARPNKTFIKQYNFDLSEDDYNKLNLNVVTLTNYACEQNRYNFNFAYVNYLNSH